VSRRLVASSGPDNAFSLMRKSTFLMVLFGLATLGLSVALAPWLVPLVMGPEFKPSVLLVQVFGIVFPFAAFNQAARMYVLIPLRHDTAVARVSILGALVNWASIGLFVTPWGGMGVVIAKIVGEVAITLATTVFIFKDRELRSVFSRSAKQAPTGIDP
jgi:O-antigen/teichoic acid export membrane protein